MDLKNFVDNIKDILDQYNKILKDNNCQHEINISKIIQDIIEKHKKFQVFRFDIELMKNNLEKNIQLLKLKLDFEYQIYNILYEHKTRLSQFKDIPKIDEYIDELFDISSKKLIHNLTEKSLETNLSSAPPPPPKNNVKVDKPLLPKKTSTLKMPAQTLQSQLSEAIKNRKVN